MSAPEHANETPNPERRSNAALLCFCIGVGLGGLAWVLGVGGLIAAALAGGSPAAVVGGLFAAIALVLMGVAGGVLTLVGAIWLIIQVIADQRGADAKERYSREVER
ncbi:MAG: hypothetical protein AB7O04_06895 [Hyphomonadaceae bacterium]